MVRASRRLARLRWGLRTGAAAGGPDARRRCGGARALVVRGARENSPLGLRPGARRRRLPDRPRHHPRHRDDAPAQMADVPHPDQRGHLFRRRTRLCARPLESASGHDGGLGLFAGRGDRNGADGRRLRRRHEAGRGHAISARGLRRTGGVDRRPGMGGLGRRGAGRQSIGSRRWRRGRSWERWRWPSAARSWA